MLHPVTRMRRYLLCIAFLILLIPLHAQVQISEVCAMNKGVLFDIEGNTPDWIELHNPTSLPIDLSGYFISDDPTNFTRYQFASLVLPANGYAIVFASGKDTVHTELHTNFSLSAKGETVYLSSQDSLLIDSLNIPFALANRTVGRFSNSQDTLSWFTVPTPGNANATAEGLTLSRWSGYFSTGEILTIEGGQPGDEIRYTLDGTPPNHSSPLYLNGIQLDQHLTSDNPESLIETSYYWEEPSQETLNAITLRAQLFRNGVGVGPAVTNTFFHDQLLQDNSRMPIISITVDPNDLFDENWGLFVPGVHYDEGNQDFSGNFFQTGELWERACYIELIEVNNQVGFAQDAGLKIHGAKRRREPQKSLRILFREEYGLNKGNYKVFDQRETNEFKRLVLRSRSIAGTEAVIVDHLAHRMVDEDLDIENQAMRAAIVYVNGEYYGIEDIVEKQDRFFLETYQNVDRDSVYVLQGYLPWALEGGTAARDEFLTLYSFIENNDLSTTANYEHVAAQIDIPNFIDYHLAEIYFANSDWPHNNLKMWKPSNHGKWRWLFYDIDAGCFSTFDNTIGHATAEEFTNIDVDTRSTLFLRKLLENDEFLLLFLRRLEALMFETFDPEKVNFQIDQIYRDYAEQMDKHIARWGYPASFERWDNALKSVKTFSRLRPCVLQQIVFQRWNYVLYSLPCAAYKLELSRLQASPNPSHDGLFELSFESSEPVLLNLNVLDMTGRTVHQGEIRANYELNTHALDLSQLHPGVYVVQLESESRWFTTRIVISEL